MKRVSVKAAVQLVSLGIVVFAALSGAFGQRNLIRDNTKRPIERSEPVGSLPGEPDEYAGCTVVSRIDCDGAGVLVEFPEPVLMVMAGWTGGGEFTCFTASGLSLSSYAPSEAYYVGSVTIGHVDNPRIVECVFEGGGHFEIKSIER